MRGVLTYFGARTATGAALVGLSILSSACQAHTDTNRISGMVEERSSTLTPMVWLSHFPTCAAGEPDHAAAGGGQRAAGLRNELGRRLRHRPHEDCELRPGRRQCLLRRAAVQALPQQCGHLAALLPPLGFQAAERVRRAEGSFFSIPDASETPYHDCNMIAAAKADCMLKPIGS